MSEDKPLSQRLKAGMRVRHYKGTVYRVQGFATHSETEDALMIYRTDSNAEWDGRVWARPKVMFDDLVEHQGEMVPRFEAVEDD